MKRFLTIAALSLSLAGCNPDQIDKSYEKVQAAAVKVCGFVPTISTVAGVLAALTGTTPAADVVKLAADKICAAVTKPSIQALESGYTPNVDGVPVEGYFVSKKK